MTNMRLLTFVLAIQSVGPTHGLRDNVALDKESRQSTTYHDNNRNLTGLATLANDGNRYQRYENTGQQVFCSHTLIDQDNYWWAVDLGETYYINSVTIYNRNDTKPERLSNIYIYVYNPMVATWQSYDQEQGQLCLYHDGEVPRVFSSSCDRNVQGRYVKIYMNGTSGTDDCLTLCEVEIYTDKNINEGSYCRQLNKIPLSGLGLQFENTSVSTCGLFCRKTEGCLGFSIETDSSCFLFKTSQQVEISADEYFERC